MQPGDVVTLKSGGPKMTIQDIEGAGDHAVAKCMFSLNGRFTSKDFPIVMLAKTEEKVKP